MYSKNIQDVKGSSVRELFKMLANPEFISLAGGAPDPHVFPKKIINRIVNQILEKEAEIVLQYGLTAGFESTRKAVAKYIKQTRGLDININNISITSGAQNAIDSILKVFIDERDLVCTESPTYLSALTALKIRAANILQIEMGNDGIDIPKLEEVFKTKPPKLLYIIPNHQNPTGISTSLEKRKKIAQLVMRHGTILVEDDPYFELSYHESSIQTIYSMIPDQTIYIGSFSKVVAPGIRLGYAIANTEIISKINLVRQFNDVQSSNISQKLVEHMIFSNEIYNVVENNKVVYDRKLRIVNDLIKKHFPKCVKTTSPKGGMFIWVELPDQFDFKKINQRFLNEHIGVVPGEEFFIDPDKKAKNTFRINFTQAAVNKIELGVIKIAEILSQQV